MHTTTITPISPFYDEHSKAPPSCTPILTDQKMLWGKVARTLGLLADEMLTLSHVDALRTLSLQVQKAAPEFKPASAKSPNTAARVLSPAPYAKRPRLKPSSKTIDSSDKGLPIDSSDDESMSSASSEIPKPPGEPGRPGRGGYNLETALGWKHTSYSKFKKYVHTLVDEHLDVSKCISAQNTALLKIVQEKATSKFPDLENYARCWPVADLIMMRLKYTSSRARKHEMEMAAGKTKKFK